MSSYNIVYIILFMISLPLSMFLWLISSAGVQQNLNFDLLWLRTTPVSWLICIYIPIVTAARYHQSRLLSFSGAVSSSILGFIHILTSTCFFFSFFVYLLIATTSIAYRGESKCRYKAVGGNEKNWYQMISIGGIPALLSYFYAVTVGLGELPINFSKYYNASVLSIAVMASWAFCTANTIATEIKLGLRNMSPHLAFIIDTAPLGIVYALAGAIGGLLIGVTYYISLHLCVPSSTLLNQPPQWPLLICSACAGFLGVITGSWLVSTLQCFVQYRNTESIMSNPIRNDNYLAKIEISKYGCIDFLTTFITSCTICYISLKVWPTN